MGSPVFEPVYSWNSDQFPKSVRTVPGKFPVFSGNPEFELGLYRDVHGRYCANSGNVVITSENNLLGFSLSDDLLIFLGDCVILISANKTHDVS